MLEPSFVNVLSLRFGRGLLSCGEYVSRTSRNFSTACKGWGRRPFT